jgi:hypothetical protein
VVRCFEGCFWVHPVSFLGRPAVSNTVLVFIENKQNPSLVPTQNMNKKSVKVQSSVCLPKSFEKLQAIKSAMI